jgi:large subunit ribosomal protein L35
LDWKGYPLMTKVKVKTHKGLKKRIRITATGKVKYKKANSGHLMSGKSGNRCRSLRKPRVLEGTIQHRMYAAVRGEA